MKTSLKILIASGVLLMLAGAASAADFSSWQKKLPITFSGYTRPETLTNFPALVVLSTNISGFSYAGFLSLTNQDLRFTTADGTNELNYEIESWDTNGSSYVWVQVASLVDTNTSVWAFWGKPGTNAPAYATNGATWDARFRGVWHMQQTNVVDATTNANNGTGKNGITTTSTGVAGSALSLDGADDYVDFGTGLQMGTGSATLSIWFKTTASSLQAGLIGKTSYRAQLGRYALNCGSGNLSGYIDAGSTVQMTTPWTSAYYDNKWHQLTATYNRTGNETLFIDGVQKATNSISAYSAVNMTGTDPFYVGAYGNTLGSGPYAGWYFPGSLDEGRLMTVALSSNWVWASYMNQVSNGAFANSFNSYGMVQSAFTGLPQVSNVGAQNRSDRSVDIVGTLITNGTSVATVYLYWSTNDCATNATAWTTGGNVTNLGSVADGTTFTNTLTGLASNTTYYWNHCAVNSSGTVWATESSPSFKTLAPPGINNGAGATDISASGATLNGILTDGAAAHVFILQGAQAGVWTVTNDLDTLSEGAFSKTISGLTPGSTNYYTCYASNECGVALATPPVAFITAYGWTGLGSSSNASEAANWAGGLPPGPGDTVVLDGATNKNMIWDAGSNGLPGTVGGWRQTADYTGTVTFLTRYGTTGFTNFTVSGDVTLAGGTWTHTANTGGETNRLRITVNGNLLITNATISANARGYSQGKGPGTGVGSWYGGAYGGATANNNGAILNPKTYGSIIAPTNLGSGGTSGAGGGAILLTVAGTTTVAAAGVISANGATAGAGGSLYLTTGWLTGSGTLRANGGDGPGDPAWGSGSGGRVAIILAGANADFNAWTGASTAYGGGAGSGAIKAAAGTVYRKTQAGVSTLIIDNNSLTAYSYVSTLMPPAPNAVNLNSFSSVVITNKGNLGVRGDTTLDFNTFSPTICGPTNSYIAIDSDTNVTYPADWLIDGYTLYGQGISKTLPHVTIGTNGVLSHYNNFTVEAYKVNLAIAGNLTILSNGAITADGRGYTPGNGPGMGVGLYGGAYGGATVHFNSGAILNPKTYGSIIAPTNLGSGGTSIAGGGVGAGGGAILLTVAGTTTVAAAGVISANGATAGAGGSLYLTTGWLTGSGTLRANGGNGPGDPGWGSGSGGRVAIILTGANADFNAWTGTNTAYGGSGASKAAAGTVYRQAAGASPGEGTVIVNNNNTATNVTFTSLPAFTNSTELLNRSFWSVQNRGKISMLTNATIWSMTLTNNSYLELAGHTLTSCLLTITNKVYQPDVYTAVQLGALVADSSGGNGKVIVLGIAPQGTVYVIR